MSASADAIFVYTPELERGGYPDVCPFNSHRAGKTRERILAMGLLDGDGRREAPPTPLERADLERFHAPDYLDTLVAAQRGAHDLRALEMGLGTPDCPVFPGLYDFARLAAGGTLTGARLIAEGRARNAFNPSGGFHHAHRDRAAGFCYVNDVVIAADYLARGGRRVAVLDIDAHHCDGVQEAFYDRGDVLTVSLHESGHTLFPGTGWETETGAGAGRGCTVNLPLPVGTNDELYEFAFRNAALPVLKAFRPDVVIVEAGMDALAGDPLAHLHLTNNTHADILEEALRLGKPVLLTGGGGYNIENTVRGWALCWSVLCGEHAHQRDLMAGMGGVMLENTDWVGGLRDRVLLSDGGRMPEIAADVRRVVNVIRRDVFPVHGLDGSAVD
jgi:acetoin utilization protein AcuC